MNILIKRMDCLELIIRQIFKILNIASNRKIFQKNNFMMNIRARIRQEKGNYEILLP